MEILIQSCLLDECVAGCVAKCIAAESFLFVVSCKQNM